MECVPDKELYCGDCEGWRMREAGEEGKKGKGVSVDQPRLLNFSRTTNL